MMNLKMRVLPLLAALAISAMADRDTNYYPGYSNPNADNDMYWNDAINVLQDLDQFEALYIKYHGCVWSDYGEGVENAEIGCGYDAYGGDEYWYLGKTQCFRANVAFSLYGVLADQEVSSSSSNCNRHTYINSFFTNLGVEGFASPLGIDSSSTNSMCTSTYVGSDNGYHDGHYTSSSSYSSTTTSCSEKGTFITAKFGGAYCNGHAYISTTDRLSDFNDAMQSQACVKVYKNGDYDSAAEQILANSTACSVRQYPERCPDPFGIKLTYTRTLEAASATTSPTASERARKWLPWLTGAFFVVGATFVGFACAAYRKASQVQAKDLEYAAAQPSPPQVTGPVVEQVPVMKQISALSHSILSGWGGGGGATREAPMVDLVEQTRSIGGTDNSFAASPARNDPIMDARSIATDLNASPAAIEQAPEPANPEVAPVVEPANEAETKEEDAADAIPQTTSEPAQEVAESPVATQHQEVPAAAPGSSETARAVSSPPPPAPSPPPKRAPLIDNAEAAAAVLAQKRREEAAAAKAETETTTAAAAPVTDKKKKHGKLSRLFSSKKNNAR